MDRDDEKLTDQNVDEQIEHYLSQSQTSSPEHAPPAMRAVRNLQNIYAENRRLEKVWERINTHASALIVANNSTVEKLSTIQPVQEEKKAPPVTNEPVMLRSRRRSQQIFRWNRRVARLALVAAIVLFAILALPLVSYALYGTAIGIIHPFAHNGLPQSQPTVEVAGMKEYSNQYFTIQYPSNWVVTHVSAGGDYQQAVQFRPSVTSAIFVNVNVLPNSDTSADQLLRMDPDVKMGSQLKTSSVTYHNILWRVGIVALAGPAHTQAGTLKVAYSHQGTPYRIEFGTTANEFTAYTPVFNAMFASFQAHTVLVVRPAPTPTVIASTTPVMTPTGTPTTPVATPPPAITLPGIKVYVSQYFTIQYPSNWVITNVSTGGTYQQTVQFRPSATSTVFVNVDVMYHNDLSSDLLLLTDPDIQMGTQLSTSSATYHGIIWQLGIVNILDSVLSQSSKVEVACSNQSAPYKVELSAPPTMFNSYTQNFNTILASFNPTK